MAPKASRTGDFSSPNGQRTEYTVHGKDGARSFISVEQPDALPRKTASAASTVGPIHSISVGPAPSDASVKIPGRGPYFVAASSSTGSGSSGTVEPGHAPSNFRRSSTVHGSSTGWPAARSAYPLSRAPSVSSSGTHRSSNTGEKCDFHLSECVNGTCNHSRYTEYSVIRNGQPVGPPAYTRTEVVRQTASALDVPIGPTPSANSPYRIAGFAEHGPKGLGGPRRAHSTRSSGSDGSERLSHAAPSSRGSWVASGGFMPPPPLPASNLSRTSSAPSARSAGARTSRTVRPAHGQSTATGTQYHPPPRAFHQGQPAGAQSAGGHGTNASSHSTAPPQSVNPYATGKWPVQPKHRALPPPRVTRSEDGSGASHRSAPSKPGTDFWNRGN